MIAFSFLLPPRWAALILVPLRYFRPPLSSVHPAGSSSGGDAGKLPFVFIWRRRPRRLYRERKKRFFFLEARYAHSGPRRNSTEAMHGQVLIVLVVPLAAFAREYFRAIREKADLRSALTNLHKKQILFAIANDRILRWVLRALKVSRSCHRLLISF